MNQQNTFRSQTTTESYAVRNKRLLSIFTSNGYNARIIGGEFPKVVIDDEVIISCYVQGFDLHFKDAPFSDKIIKTIKLKRDVTMDGYELEEILNISEHQPAYKIKHIISDLHLVGFDFLNKEERIGRFPVFAKEKPLVYANHIKAQTEIERLTEDGYKVEITEN